MLIPIAQTKGVFELRVTKGKEEAVWTIDLKKTGQVTKGPAQGKPDVTLTFSDDDFVDLSSGKVPFVPST